MLIASEIPLEDHYDLAMLDLDGVVYVGADAVPGAPEHLAAVRESGLRLAFITNNAARTPQQVAEHLEQLGVSASPEDVVTSAQAAAGVLAQRLGAGGRVVVLGAVGLREAVTAAGLVAVEVDAEADALVTGYGPDVAWRDIMRAAVRIRDGLWWVASNTDHTIPTPFGRAPGHGVLVDMVQRFTGVTPEVAGKPERPLLDETVRRVGGSRPLMIGDRLDTDILGGRNADVDTLLVLTGVSGLAEIASARPEERPHYISADLAGLRQPHQVPVVEGTASRLGELSAEVVDGHLEVTGAGPVDDWWRVVADAAWRHLDLTGHAADVGSVSPPTDG